MNQHHLSPLYLQPVLVKTDSTEEASGSGGKSVYFAVGDTMGDGESDHGNKQENTFYALLYAHVQMMMPITLGRMEWILEVWARGTYTLSMSKREEILLRFVHCVHVEDVESAFGNIVATWLPVHCHRLMHAKLPNLNCAQSSLSIVFCYILQQGYSQLSEIVPTCRPSPTGAKVSRATMLQKSRLHA